MKRNMELVRAILLEVEKNPSPDEWVDLHLKAWSQEDIAYHVMLLVEAELLVAADATCLGARRSMVERLIWRGHDFLAAAGEKSIWRSAMTRIGGAFAAASFDVVTAILVDEARKRLGLSS